MSSSQIMPVMLDGHSGHDVSAHKVMPSDSLMVLSSDKVRENYNYWCGESLSRYTVVACLAVLREDILHLVSICITI